MLSANVSSSNRGITELSQAEQVTVSGGIGLLNAATPNELRHT